MGGSKSSLPRPADSASGPVGRCASMEQLSRCPRLARSEIAKLLVHRSARKRGIAELLMEHAESEARAEGKTLLVLDTCAGGDAERLYIRLGWTRVGVIPNYALYPDGRPCDTTIFWKPLSVTSGPSGTV